MITEKDRLHLRNLAKRQLEYANLPVMAERTKKWYAHNDLKSNQPMMHVETWTFENDILPELKCESEDGRMIELQFLREMLNHEMIDDDRVVKDFFGIGPSVHFKLFNTEIKRHYADGGGIGHEFMYVIKEFPEDAQALDDTVYGADIEAGHQKVKVLNDLFGDILPVKIASASLGASITQDIVHFMGMEKMLFAMIDHPDEFKIFTERIGDSYISFYKWLEGEKLLKLNNGNDHLGQGSFGFTNKLPVQYGDVTTKDLWGYMDSQETVSISPAMFKEFFYPYYKKVGDLFGRLSYGCCEPVHAFWDDSISKFENLSKVSISPWCDEEFMGERLRGSQIIYHRKPSPNYLGVGSVFDEDGYSKHIIKTLMAAKGCKLEFAFRDVYTLCGDREKPRKAVKILRNLIDEYWC